MLSKNTRNILIFLFGLFGFGLITMFGEEHVDQGMAMGMGMVGVPLLVLMGIILIMDFIARLFRSKENLETLDAPDPSYTWKSLLRLIGAAIIFLILSIFLIEYLQHAR